MRLQEIYCIATDAIQQLSAIDTLYTKTHKNVFDKHFLQYLMSTIKKLEPIQIIRHKDLYFIEWFIIPVNGDFQIPTQEENERIYQITKNMKYELENILEVCKVVGAEPNGLGFCVKLPSNMTLSQLSCCTKDLDSIFTQCPLFRYENGVIAFSGIDIGSFWLTFAIVGSAAVAILSGLATMIDKVIQIYSHVLTLKEQEEELRRRKISNDVVEEIVLSNKKIVEQLLQYTIEDLASSKGIKCPEEQENLKYTMRLLFDWMSRGMEIYASVKAPQEIKALFPTVEQQKIFTHLRKVLQSTDENATESEEKISL